MQWLVPLLIATQLLGVFAENVRLRKRKLSPTGSKDEGVCDDSGCPLSVVLLAGGISSCLALLVFIWRLTRKDWSTVKLSSKSRHAQASPLPPERKAADSHPLPSEPAPPPAIPTTPKASVVPTVVTA